MKLIYVLIKTMPSTRPTIESLRAAAQDACSSNDMPQFIDAWDVSSALLKSASHRQEVVQIRERLIDFLLSKYANHEVLAIDQSRLNVILQDYAASLLKRLVNDPGDERIQREVFNRVASCLRYGGEMASDFVKTWCVADPGN